MEMTFREWLTTNPSGYDHHDPQNTIDGFEEWLEDVIEDVERDFHLK